VANEYTYALGKGDTFVPFTDKPVALTAPTPRAPAGSTQDPMAGVMRQLSQFVNQQTRLQAAQQKAEAKKRPELPTLEEVAAAEGWTTEDAQERYDNFTRRIALEAAGNKITNIDTIQNNVRSRYDPDFESWLTSRGGSSLQKPAKESSAISDTLYSLFRGGAQQLGEATTGIGQLLTGGHMPESLTSWLDEKRAEYEANLSPETQRQRQVVQETEGFLPTASALMPWNNPRALATLASENIAGSIGPGFAVRQAEKQIAKTVTGQALKRAAEPVTSRLPGFIRNAPAPVRAGAVGEALVTMGQEGFQRAKDGDLSLNDYLASLGIGATTGLIALSSGGFATRRGFGNLESALIPESIPGAPVLRAGVRIPGTAAIEGLEEIAQEGMQQIIGNIADGKPWNEGLGNAMAMGGVLGFAMGGTVESARTGIRSLRGAETSTTPLPEVPPVQPAPEGGRIEPTVGEAAVVEPTTEVVEPAVAAAEEQPTDIIGARLNSIASMEDAAARQTEIETFAAELRELTGAEVSATDITALINEIRQQLQPITSTEEAGAIRNEALAEIGAEEAQTVIEDAAAIFDEANATAEEVASATEKRRTRKKKTELTPATGNVVEDIAAIQDPVERQQQIESVAQTLNQPVEQLATEVESVVQRNTQTTQEVQNALRTEERAQTAQEVTTGTESLASIGGVATAISDNLYQMLWNKVQAGSTIENGQQSAILQAAKLVRDNGGLQSLETFKSFGRQFATRTEGLKGQERNRVIRQLVSEFIPQEVINEPETAQTVQAETQRQQSTETTLDPVQIVAEFSGLQESAELTALNALDLINEVGTNEQAIRTERIRQTYDQTGDPARLMRDTARLVERFNQTIGRSSTTTVQRDGLGRHLNVIEEDYVNRQIGVNRSAVLARQNKTSYLDAVARFEEDGTFSAETARQLRQLSTALPHLFNQVAVSLTEKPIVSATYSTDMMEVLLSRLGRTKELLVNNEPHQALQQMMLPALMGLSPEHKVALLRDYRAALINAQMEGKVPQGFYDTRTEVQFGYMIELSERLQQQGVQMNSPLWQFSSPEAYFLHNIQQYLNTPKQVGILQSLKNVVSKIADLFRVSGENKPGHAVKAIFNDMISRPVKPFGRGSINTTAPIIKSILSDFGIGFRGNPKKAINMFRMAGAITPEQETQLLWLVDKYPSLMRNINFRIAMTHSGSPATAGNAITINPKFITFAPYVTNASDALNHEIFHMAHHVLKPDTKERINTMYKLAKRNIIDNIGKEDVEYGGRTYYGLKNANEFVAEVGSAQLEFGLTEKGIPFSTTGLAAANFIREWPVDSRIFNGFNGFEILAEADFYYSNPGYQALVDNGYIAPVSAEQRLLSRQQEQINSPQFKSWFGDWTDTTVESSKVVKDNGQPLIVHHAGTFDPTSGTAFRTEYGAHFGSERAAQIRDEEVYRAELAGQLYDATEIVYDEEFDSYTWRVNHNDVTLQHGFETDGEIFTREKDAEDAIQQLADDIASEVSVYGENGLQYHSYYLDIRNPMRVPHEKPTEFWTQDIARAKELGHDGIVYESTGDPGSNSWIAFYPEQIKSAEINNGEFSGPLVNENMPRDTPKHGSAASQVLTALSLPPVSSESLPSYADWNGMQKFSQRLATTLSDAYTPIRRWLERMPVLPALKQRAIDALYLGQNLGASMRSDIQENHGGKEAQLRINKVAAQLGMAPEAVSQRVGIWLTANWSTTANQRIYAQLEHSADVKRFEARIKQITNSKMEVGNKIRKIEDAYGDFNRASRRLQNFVNAIAAPETAEKHQFPLAGGYNTAQVAQVKTMIESQIPVQYIRHIADSIWQMNTERLMRDIENQRVTTEQLATFVQPNRVNQVNNIVPQIIDLARNASSFDGQAMTKLNNLRDSLRKLLKSEYVPFYGSLSQDETSAGGRKSINSAPLKLLEGSTYRVPDDGITTSYQAVESSVKHMRWRPFTLALYEIANQLTNKQVQEVGLSKPRQSTDAESAPFANTVRVRDADGAQYSIGIKNGALARLLAEPIPPYWMMPVVGGMSWVTRSMGYMITQLNPGFGPVNMMRDIQERASLMAARDYAKADGGVINSAKLAARTVALAVIKGNQYARAGFRWGMNKQFVDSPAGQFLKSLDRHGGLTVYSQQFGKDNQVARSNRLAQYISAYNNAFNIVAVLASYEAMLEAGMSEQRAAAETLDLANFNKSGTSGPMLSALYAFSRSAFMGGSNFFGAIYNPATGRLRPKGLATLTAATLLYGIVWSMAADMSDDDEGGNKLLQLSDAVTAGNFMFPVGPDNFVKIPVAFGLMRLANNTGKNLVQMSRGFKDPSAVLMGTAVNGLMPAISPFMAPPSSASDMPLFTLVSSLTPTMIEPALLTAMNRTPFGNELNRPPLKGFNLATDPRSNAPEFWKDLAVSWTELTGQATSPEAMRQLMEGYLPGFPNEVLNAFVNNPHREQLGYVTQTPLVSRFYVQYDPNRKRMTLESRVAGDEKLKERYNKELGAINTRYRGIYKLPEAQRRTRQMQINEERMLVINKLLLETQPR